MRLSDCLEKKFMKGLDIDISNKNKRVCRLFFLCEEIQYFFPGIKQEH